MTSQREDLGMCKEGAAEKQHWRAAVPPVPQSPTHRGAEKTSTGKVVTSTGKVVTSTRKVVTIVQEQGMVADG